MNQHSNKLNPVSEFQCKIYIKPFTQTSYCTKSKVNSLLCCFRRTFCLLIAHLSSFWYGVFSPARFGVQLMLRVLRPMQTDATLLANNTQHCWAQHVASVYMEPQQCLHLLALVAYSVKSVKLFRPMQTDATLLAKNPQQHVVTCCVRLHGHLVLRRSSLLETSAIRQTSQAKNIYHIRTGTSTRKLQNNIHTYIHTYTHTHIHTYTHTHTHTHTYTHTHTHTHTYTHTYIHTYFIIISPEGLFSDNRNYKKLQTYKIYLLKGAIFTRHW